MPDLDALGRTALIPFWARVQDALASAPILDDHAALAIAPHVRGRFGVIQVGASIQAGCCLRNRVMDEWIADLAGGGSGVRTVVDIGVGLDTRLLRRPRLAERYVEVDRPAMIDLRDEWLPDTAAVRVRADGMRVEEWIGALGQQGPPSTVVLVLEGVLVYQDPATVVRFFADAARRLPGAYVLFDSVSPPAAWSANRPAMLAQGGQRYAWALWRTRRIVAGEGRLRILREAGFVDLPHDVTRAFTGWQRMVYSLPPMRRSYRLTLARLPQ